MLTFSGFGQLPIATDPSAPAVPSMRRTAAAMLTQPEAAAFVAPPPAPACPYGYNENQGVCVSDGCVDGKSQCIVLDGSGQTCSYDQYLAYWHASGVQSCGPAPQAQPTPSAPTAPPQPPTMYGCPDGSFAADPALCPQPAPSQLPPPQQQLFACPDGSLVADLSFCLSAQTQPPGTGPSPTDMPPQTVVSPPILPALDTGTFWTPDMILGLGAVASLAAAFLAYKSEGSTRAIASIGALGIGGFTAYKAAQLYGILPMPTT